MARASEALTPRTWSIPEILCNGCMKPMRDMGLWPRGQGMVRRFACDECRIQTAERSYPMVIHIPEAA